MLYPTVLKKLEFYCSYQERSHKEVRIKLKSLKIEDELIDEYIVYLIHHNYLNEERFACAFARGKHNYKKWGKIRISNELKLHGVSSYIIKTALREIEEDKYVQNFNELAEKEWHNTKTIDLQRKKRKISDFLFRKGYESHLIFEKIEALCTLD
ncbi:MULTISPECIES: regulatory protein RecX [Flavobacterium]|uniref:Regulatory protein RecX n=2 Tax=Flavobacterium TaxID=237 RepID=A0AA94F196_9FLAO|nr:MULTISPECIES: regulatory protein RecX [Flavobacterium]AMA48081.1 recombinase RecX [Flavobacterium covae]AND63772.1 recombinase RecX [Flavobacterium covae]MCH4829986.1 regulatory protein RecX [Flavobacterium columnare]MCH4832634.1 regulatory protein RecX [Flavobacterium columnare]MCJ1807676.1 RecX family transcriptional regulator [Flavobacterium covae]